MKSNIESALKSASDTQALETGRGILPQVAAFFKRNFPEKRGLVVCDRTTWAVVGEVVYQQLEEEGVAVTPFIFPEPRPYAGIENVDKLEEFMRLSDAAAIAVAVGSGTLNDLAKLASGRLERPYMCVATAASMDGYTAYGASITADGNKKTFPCPAPYAVFADIDVIRNAPPEMTAAGYADLFAKVTAGADWILADMLGAEPIDVTAWHIVQDGLQSALADPAGAREGRPDAIELLLEGLLLGGFAMQSSRTSRPASGAEHQFSHLWNMEHHTHNGEIPAHGFQVGIATLAITRLYEVMMAAPLDRLNVPQTIAQWPSWEQQKARIEMLFAGTDFTATALQQSKEKYIPTSKLTVQLEKLRSNWPLIKMRLSKQIIPSGEVKKRLDAVGAPTTPEQIGISAVRLRNAYQRAQCIRSRFTILDVAFRTNSFDNWLKLL
ncbi:MAG: sn-glycerol-1-phosphate dehydrogenase [Bacteroidales bacterium]|nr:sn-glycerol-1-phosphate dehydrogenase [Bacteroidales bacterium]